MTEIERINKMLAEKKCLFYERLMKGIVRELIKAGVWRFETQK